MTKTRNKAPAIAVPQSDGAANALLQEYGETSGVVARMEADLNDALAKVKAHYETLAQPHEERLKVIFESLSAFGAAHRDRLTGNGKSKTVLLAAGEFGWRKNPPSVKWARGMTVEKIIENIKAAGMRRFIRLKEEPNKDRMLDEPDAAKMIEGVRIDPGAEAFFVAPFGAEISEPK
jgi:phage host-nuclease inhibitor protein Gam